MSLIKCDDITLTYENKVVFKNLSFEINKGDYLCIVGENGSGKTTLLKAILNLKDVHDGKIVRNIDQSKIGYLNQQHQIQKDFPASVLEVVLSGLLSEKSLFPFYTKKDKIKACECLDKLDILDIKNLSFKELSGGQQQRVLIARAILSAREMIVLDEPLKGLDPIAANEMYEILDKLNKENKTVVMVSHDIKSAVSNAKQILHLSDKEFFYGSTLDYLNSKLGRAYLGGNIDV